MDNEYKFYYFGGNGRAMIPRAIFYAAKKPFIDNIIDFKDWPAKKTSGQFEFQFLPSLEYKGKTYSQSHAIEEYLAKSFDLYGKDIEEEYQISSILLSYDDMFALFHDINWPVPGKNVEEVKKAYQAKVEMFLQAFEKRYVSFGFKKFFLGDHFSLADIALTIMFGYFADHDLAEGTIKKNAPKLSELFDRVKKEELKEYYAKGYIATAPF